MVRLAMAAVVCLIGIRAFLGYAVPEILDGRQEGGTKADKTAEPWPAVSGEKVREMESVARVSEGAKEDATADFLPETDLARLYSPFAVLLDADSGQVLAGHNGRKRIYPASLTKMMTAVVVLEHTEDLSERITLSEEMFSMLYLRHASLAGFEPGETVCVRDLLYGILLPSGAECSIACAEKIAGSEEEFVKLMNRKAAELGMEDTHFCNVTGLHEKKHFSTAEDMAVLLRYALQNDVFREILSSRSHVTEATEVHPEGLIFESTLFALLDTADVPGGEILGGKTGYTNEAGLCLASFARIGGKEYILVTAGATGSHQTEAFHVLDAKSVYGGWGEQILQ